jgi:adenosylmethionine-8-amino-7-oxononanoate aminotransferase
VKALCQKYGTLYIADEVQTGFMRCGEMWGWQSFGVEPDLFIAAKGLSGGLYPIADKRVLQFKPGALMSRAICEEVLDRFDAAIPRIRALTAEFGRG